jgi:signal transduction histidine kinase
MLSAQSIFIHDLRENFHLNRQQVIIILMAKKRISSNIIFSIFTLFVIIALSIPFVISLKEYYISIEQKITQTHLELSGAETLGALLKLEQHFFKHVFESGEANSSFDWNSQLNFLKREIIDKKAGKIKNGFDEQANLAFADIENMHLRIAEEKSQNKRILLWLEFASDMRLVTDLIVDGSSLIVDPDKDSYYLINSIAVHVPQFVGSLASNLLAPKGDSAELQRHIASEYFRVLKNSLKASLVFDKEFYGESPSLQADVQKAMLEMDNIMFGSDPQLEKYKQLSIYLSEAVPTLNEDVKTLLKLRIQSVLAERDSKIKNVMMIWFLMLYIIFMGFVFILHSRRKMKKIISAQHRQLEISSKLASVGEFTASIGHEIINPVAAISGFVEIIQTRINRMPESQDRVKVLQFLARISRNADRVIGIVRSLKNLVKEEKTGEFRSVLLKDILIDIEQIFNAKLAKEKIKLLIKLQDDSIACLGSEIEVFQILTNLISNSIGALKNCEERVISVEGFSHGAEVMILVNDSGPGIPENLKTKIFEPLFTTKVEGTGLGLQICVKLAGRMNGSLKLGNCTKGACFELRLPTVPGLLKDINKAS